MSEDFRPVPLQCSQGGIPFNKAHLDAKDAEIARLRGMVRDLLWAATTMRGVRMLDNLTVLQLQNVDAAIKAAKG